MPRTPNPPPGQRLPLPNHFAIVEQVALDVPAALAASCQSWQFLDLVVARLREIDTRWGYNGKRGNIDDPSHDVVAYNYSSDPDQGTTQVYIIDVIGGHCGGNPQPAWIDQTAATAAAGTIGRWTDRVNANPGGGPVTLPPVTTTCQAAALDGRLDALMAMVDATHDEAEGLRAVVALALDESRQTRAAVDNLLARMEQGGVIDASIKYLGPVKGTVRF